MDIEKLLERASIMARAYQGKGSVMEYSFSTVNGVPNLVLDHRIVLEFAVGKKLKELLLAKGRKDPLLKEHQRVLLLNAIEKGLGHSYSIDLKLMTMRDKTHTTRIGGNEQIKVIRHGLIVVIVKPITDNRPIDENSGKGIVELITQCVYTWRTETLEEL